MEEFSATDKKCQSPQRDLGKVVKVLISLRTYGLDLGPKSMSVDTEAYRYKYASTDSFKTGKKSQENGSVAGSSPSTNIFRLSPSSINASYSSLIPILSTPYILVYDNVAKNKTHKKEEPSSCTLSGSLDTSD